MNYLPPKKKSAKNANKFNLLPEKRYYAAMILSDMWRPYAVKAIRTRKNGPNFPSIEPSTEYCLELWNSSKEKTNVCSKVYLGLRPREALVVLETLNLIWRPWRPQHPASMFKKDKL